MAAAEAAAFAAFSSSCGLGMSPDPRLHCWSDQSLRQQKSRPRCRPQTCWSLLSGTDGRCWNLLRAWREKNRSSSAGVVSPGHSRRCGKLHCWTERLQTWLVEACQWKRQLTGFLCCPAGLSALKIGALRESAVVSALRSGPGSYWVKLGRPLEHLQVCCRRENVNNKKVWKLEMLMNPMFLNPFYS